MVDITRMKISWVGHKTKQIKTTAIFASNVINFLPFSAVVVEVFPSIRSVKNMNIYVQVSVELYSLYEMKTVEHHFYVSRCYMAGTRQPKTCYWCGDIWVLVLNTIFPKFEIYKVRTYLSFVTKVNINISTINISIHTGPKHLK